MTQKPKNFLSKVNYYENTAHPLELAFRMVFWVERRLLYEGGFSLIKIIQDILVLLFVFHRWRRTESKPHTDDTGVNGFFTNFYKTSVSRSFIRTYLLIKRHRSLVVCYVWIFTALVKILFYVLMTPNLLNGEYKVRCDCY